MCSCSVGGRSHSWEIHFLSHSHKPLCSFLIWKACVFVWPPRLGLFLDIWQQCCHYSPLKACFYSFTAIFSAFEGIQSGITEDITIPVQRVSNRHLLSTKQTVVNVGKNKRFALNFLCLFSFVSKFMSLGRVKYHCCWVHGMNNGWLILYNDITKWKTHNMPTQLLRSPGFQSASTLRRLKQFYSNNNYLPDLLDNF